MKPRKVEAAMEMGLDVQANGQSVCKKIPRHELREEES
jgi:hypothetical protein